MVAWHLWMGNARTEGRHEFRDHILCFKAADENPPESEDYIHVTTQKADVSCRDCLELIHS